MSALFDRRIILVSNSDWSLYNFHLPVARALRQYGCDVILASPRAEFAPQLEAEGFRFLDWDVGRRSLSPFKELSAIRQLFRMYRQESPRAVHHFTVKPNLYGTIAARLAHIPVIVNSWEGLGFTFTSSARAKMLRTGLVPLMRLAFWTKRLWTIFLNEHDSQLFVRLKLIKSSRMSVIRGVGVDTNRFSRGSKVKSGTLVVLMASRMLWDKGVNEFVESMRVLRQRGVTARFWLCGSSDMGNPNFVPKATLDSWRQEGQIEVLGHRQDMADLLRQAHIVVLPSYYPEGLPRILLEAAATGLPLVATDIQGCRAIVRDKTNGFLVPPKNVTALADAIQHLLEDEGLRTRFGRASRRIAVEEFSEPVIIREYLDTYQLAGLLD